MSLSEINDSEACVLIEMQLRTQIDNNIDDFELEEDKTVSLREDGTACYREY